METRKKFPILFLLNYTEQSYEAESEREQMRNKMLTSVQCLIGSMKQGQKKNAFQMWTFGLNEFLQKGRNQNQMQKF